MVESPRLIYRLPERFETGPDGAGRLVWGPGSGPFEALERAFAMVPGVNGIEVRKGLFSAEECARIIAAGEASAPAPGDATGGSRYRVSRIGWLQPTPGNLWVFHRLGVLFALANARFGFELEGFLDPLQYTLYGPGEFFDWHLDIGSDETCARKLSVTVQLSAADEYAGGELEFLNIPEFRTERAAGDATVFPAYLAHRVSPVTSGERRSLVAWACGPSFR